MGEASESSREQSELTVNEWDALRPENNGIGEFGKPETTHNVEVGMATESHIDARNVELPESAIERDGPVFEPSEWDLKILEDDWTPEWDYEYKKATFPEIYEDLEYNTNTLSRLLSIGESTDVTEYCRNKYKSRRQRYVSVIKKMERGERTDDISNLPPKLLLEFCRRQLVEARFEVEAMKNPEQTFTDLKADLATFTELAKIQREANFERVNHEEIHQKNTEFLAKIPKKRFAELARQMTPEKFSDFDANLKKTFAAALDVDLSRIEFIEVRTKCDSLGTCTHPRGSGIRSPKTVLEPDDKIKVSLNFTKLVATEKLSDYAGTLGHELRHAKQYLEALDNPMSDYWLGITNYVRSRDDYARYREQKIEQEAYDFEDQFRVLFDVVVKQQSNSFIKKLNPRYWLDKRRRENIT